MDNKVIVEVTEDGEIVISWYRDGKFVEFLSGPYPTKEEAEADLPMFNELAESL